MGTIKQVAINNKSNAFQAEIMIFEISRLCTIYEINLQTQSSGEPAQVTQIGPKNICLVIVYT